MKKYRVLSVLLTAALVFSNANMTLYANAEESTSSVEEFVENMESTEDNVSVSSNIVSDSAPETESIPSESTDNSEILETPDSIVTLIPSVSDNYLNATTEIETDSILIEECADMSGVYQNGALEVLNTETSDNDYIQLVDSQGSNEAKAIDVLYRGMLAKKQSIDVSDYAIDKDRIAYLVSGIINEHPELYYVTSFSWNYYSNTKKTAYVMPAYQNGLDDAAFKRALADALSMLDDDMTDMEKAIALHEYLATNCAYDYENYLANTIPQTSYSAYGALVKRTAVCQGYALAYKYLCNQVGIDCYMVTSTAMNHAWNMIVLGDALYQVDVTWDDPTWDQVGRATHQYMFISDEAMKARQHHDWEVTVGSDVVPLAAEDTTYDDYFWKNTSSPLIQEGNTFYYVDYNTTGYKVSLSKFNLEDQSTQVIANLGNWHSFGDSSSFWQGGYSGLFKLDDRLFYNTEKEIQSVLPDGSDARTEYTPDISAGYVYGIAYAQGKVEYLISESPRTVQKGTISTLELDQLQGGTYAAQVGKIVLDQKSLTLRKGTQAVLQASVLPSYVSGIRLQWTSNNEQIATVEDGIITGVSRGNCIITAQAGGKKAQCTVQVTEKLDAPKLVPTAGTYAEGSEAITIDRNAAVTLTAKEGATIYYSTDGWKTTITYSEPIVVSQNMTISAKAVMEGYEDSDAVTQKYIACDNELVLSGENLKITEGGTGSVTVTKLPTGKKSSDVQWSSSNETLVTCVGGKVTSIRGNDGTAVITATVTDHKNSVVTAQCIVTVAPLQYKVTFKDWNGKVLETQTVAARRDAVLPEAPQRTGYDFIEWKGNTQNINKNETVTASYLLKEYTLTYDLNGGVEAGDNPDFYTIETADIKLKNASGQPGTLFNGWYETDKNIPTTVIKKGSTGDVVLKAAWKLAVPEFSLPAGRVAEGDYLILSAAKSDAAIYYTLDGSMPVVGNDNCYKYENAIRMDETIAPQKKVQIKAIVVLDGYQNSDVVTAQYTVVIPNRYHVVFRDWNGEVLQDAVVLEGKDAQFSYDNPSRAGYEFTGWKGNYTNVTRDENVTAQYSPCIYSIRYVLGEGSNDTTNPNTYTVESASITLKPAGNNPGYFFDGWYRDAEYTDPISEIRTGSYGDMVLYAKWTSIKTDVGLWVAGIENQRYTGKAIKPEVQVYDGNVLLEENRDYTVSYRNNIKVNQDFASRTVPTVIITGKGEYIGKAETTFLILPRDIGEEDNGVAVEDLVLQTYGREQKPDVKLYIDKRRLRESRDYELTYWLDDQEVAAVSEAGNYRIKITGIGSYTGTRWINLTLTAAKLISSTTAERIASQNYTGDLIEPGVTLRDGMTVLTEGVDYTLQYTNNKYPGTATVIVKGCGNYAGERRLTFSIIGISMSNVSVTGLQSDFNYTGSDIIQSGYILTTEWRGSTYALTEGTDYEVSYSGNRNAGTAYITFNGIGGFRGRLSRAYQIHKIEIADDTGDLEIDDISAGSLISSEKEYVTDYTKGGAKPAPTIKVNGVTLVAGVDYTIRYRNNNTASSNGTMIITGKGSFRGTIKVPFGIKQKDLSASDNSGVTMTAPDKVYRDVENNYLIVPSLKDSNGRTMRAGTDYDRNIRYTYTQRTVLDDGTIRRAGDSVQSGDILPVGTEIKVSVTGKGNYRGTIESSYRIVEKDIKFASVYIPKQTYHGKEVTLDASDITIRFGGTELKPSDYEIVGYENNNRTGIATVTIKGIGDTYGGTKKVRFRIGSSQLIWWWSNRQK